MYTYTVSINKYANTQCLVIHLYTLICNYLATSFYKELIHTIIQICTVQQYKLLTNEKWHNASKITYPHVEPVLLMDKSLFFLSSSSLCCPRSGGVI